MPDDGVRRRGGHRGCAAARCWTCCRPSADAHFPNAISGAAGIAMSATRLTAERCVAAAAPRRLAAGAGGPDPDAPRRRRLAARRRLAVLSLVLVARGKIRQAAAGHPHAGARLRAAARARPSIIAPHLRQSRRSSSRSSASTGRCRPGADLYQPLSNVGRIDRAHDAAVALSRSRHRGATPSSASSARRCASCRHRATSCSRSASISIRCRCSNAIPTAPALAAILRRAARPRSTRPSSTTRG